MAQMKGRMTRTLAKQHMIGVLTSTVSKSMRVCVRVCVCMWMHVCARRCEVYWCIVVYESGGGRAGEGRGGGELFFM
jgi:hypothetical protein